MQRASILSHTLPHTLPLSPTADPEGALLHWGLFRGDNYGYFLQTGPREVIAVDVPDGRRMLEFLRERNWRLKTLLLTHTHHDHVVDLEELLEETGCGFLHPRGAELKVSGTPLSDGDRLEVEGLELWVMDTSGHSPLDFSYHFPEFPLCFCGDTLFAWGCGRMFAGPPERFWRSLCRLRALPDNTRICCGHDYVDDNRRFIRQTLPELPGLCPSPGEGGMPMTLAEQKSRNPFLRADDPAVAAALGMAGADPVAVFKKLREARNRL